MSVEFPFYLAGQWQKSEEALTVRSPYDAQIVGHTFRASPAHIEEAIVSAEKAFHLTRVMPVYERSEKLFHTAAALGRDKDKIAGILSAEAGKPIKAALAEVERARLTFTDAAEECKRIRGEHMPLDYEPASKNRWALIRRFPIGPILGISPFNFPLNLVCHKVAPALAAGNTIILKPASQTPLSALLLAGLIDEAGWPAGTVNVLPMESSNAYLLVGDDRIKMLTFTGSPVVGWALKAQSGHKKVTLELGGNAGVIIHHDADIEQAAARCIYGGFALSGQSCISVQRIYVHDDVYEPFMEIFLAKVRALKCGDPAREETDIGPLIHPDEVARVSAWLEEAVAQGAKIITGGNAQGSIFLPTVLTDVDPEMKVNCQEIFAPVVNIFRYTDIDQALQSVNNSDYGLQAGIFTNDARILFRAYETLEVGGLIAGDVPTYRIDPMPYGGVKMSGMGREGARFAIEEMTEPKLLVMNIG